MSGRRYGRLARVSVKLPTSLTDVGQTTITVTGLRVEFSVEKDLGEEPNDGEVKIYNLAERTRGELQQRPLHIVLEAGYDERPEVIFRGDVRWSESVREGTEWVTTLQLGDWERVYRHARVSQSMRRNAKLGEAVRRVAEAMGLRVASSVRDLPAMAKQFAAGLALHGEARREMTRLLDIARMTWSVQDGQLQILGGEAGEVTREDDVVIDETTGLQNSPEFGSPPPDDKKPTLSFDTSLRPDIRPGRAVVVQASGFTAGANRFKVSRVVHGGDTHGSTWRTSVEAEPL